MPEGGGGQLRALLEYSKLVYNDITYYDDYTWKQVCRNIRFAFRHPKLESYGLAAMYYYLVVCDKLHGKDASLITSACDMLQIFQQSSFGRICKFEFEYDLSQHARLIEQMSVYLHTHAHETDMSDNELEMIKALLLIVPENNPFTSKVLDKIYNCGTTDIYNKIQDQYAGKDCDIHEYIVADSIMEYEKSLRKKPSNLDDLILALDNIDQLGKRSAEKALKLILSDKKAYSADKQSEYSEKLGEIAKCADMKDSILYQAYLREHPEVLEVSDDPVLSDYDFLILCMILKYKNNIQANQALLERIAFNNQQKLILSVFLRTIEDTDSCFFSVKSNRELWFNYIPFTKTTGGKTLEVPLNGNGSPWPGCDRANQSPYAMYVRADVSTIYVSIEFCSKTGELRDALLDRMTGTPDRVNSKIVRLSTMTIKCENTLDSIKKATDRAFNEFCRIGDRLTKAAMEIEKEN